MLIKKAESPGRSYGGVPHVPQASSKSETLSNMCSETGRVSFLSVLIRKIILSKNIYQELHDHHKMSRLQKYFIGFQINDKAIISIYYLSKNLCTDPETLNSNEISFISLNYNLIKGYPLSMKGKKYPRLIDDLYDYPHP